MRKRNLSGIYGRDKEKEREIKGELLAYLPFDWVSIKLLSLLWWNEEVEIERGCTLEAANNLLLPLLFVCCCSCWCAFFSLPSWWILSSCCFSNKPFRLLPLRENNRWICSCLVWSLLCDSGRLFRELEIERALSDKPIIAEPLLRCCRCCCFCCPVAFRTLFGTTSLLILLSCCCCCLCLCSCSCSCSYSC